MPQGNKFQAKPGFYCFIKFSWFEEAINLDPNYTLAYFNAGRACQKMGFTNDAANYYQMAIDLNKDSEELDEDDIMDRLRKLFEV